MAESGQIHELSVDQSYGGVNLTNVYHYRSDYDATSDAAANQGLIEAYRNTIEPLWDDLVTTDIATVCYTAKTIWPNDEATDPFIDVVTVPGTLTPDTLPPNKSYVMQLFTDYLERGGSGRKFYAGAPEDGDTDGQLHTTAYSNWTNILGAALVAQITDATAGKPFSLGIFSRKIAAELIKDPELPLQAWHRLVGAWLLPTVRSVRDRVAKVILATPTSSMVDPGKIPTVFFEAHLRAMKRG